MKESIVECPTRYYYLIAFELDPTGEDADLVNAVHEKVRELEATSAAPSGRRRGSGELMNTRYLGVLSEMLLIEHLQHELGQSVRVFNRTFVDYSDHVDIEIEANGQITTAEVRSSFPYTSLQNVVCRVFDAIGPYSTSYKPDESPKDFYLRGLINERMENFSFDREHTFYFAGGAPYHWFEEKGKIKDFDQQGAEFLTIPLVQAMDARQIVDAIGRHISGI